MSTETTTQHWLELAENEYEEENVQRDADLDSYAAELADAVNTRLAELGIAPLTPASTDGTGKLIPAKLTEADPKQKLYGVHASFDEDEGYVYLLVTGKPGFDHTIPLEETSYEIGSCDAAAARRCVVLARREGPKPKPFSPPRPSVDTDAIVAALDNLRAAVDSVARGLSRP